MMEAIVSRMLQEYETGKLNRRDLVAGLAALAGIHAGGISAAAAEEQSQGPIFQATRLNHIALSVTDVPKSRDFYRDLLGMTPTRDSESSCFLTFGKDFLALFKGEQAEMHHYCYSIENYDVHQAAEKLRARGIQPGIHDQRIYFPDPDGLTVQLAATDHTP